MKEDTRSLWCLKRRSGGDRTLLRGSARKPGQLLQGVTGSHRVQKREAEQAFFATLELKHKLMKEVSDEIQRKFPQDVLVLKTRSRWKKMSCSRQVKK